MNNISKALPDSDYVGGKNIKMELDEFRKRPFEVHNYDQQIEIVRSGILSTLESTQLRIIQKALDIYGKLKLEINSVQYKKMDFSKNVWYINFNILNTVVEAMLDARALVLYEIAFLEALVEKQTRLVDSSKASIKAAAELKAESGVAQELRSGYKDLINLLFEKLKDIQTLQPSDGKISELRQEMNELKANIKQGQTQQPGITHAQETIQHGEPEPNPEEQRIKDIRKRFKLIPVTERPRFYHELKQRGFTPEQIANLLKDEGKIIIARQINRYETDLYGKDQPEEAKE